MLSQIEQAASIAFRSPEGRELRIELDISKWSWLFTVVQDGEILTFDLYQQCVGWPHLCQVALGREHHIALECGTLILRKLGDHLAIILETEAQPPYLAADGLVGLVEWADCVELVHALERQRPLTPLAV